ncbi:MAG: dTDP-4-dehydrorhamnose reductase [Sphingopyxis sp.]
MHILVIGQAGQLAQSLADRAGARATITLLGRPALDLTSAHAAAQLARAPRPDAIINAAAYTAVDRAEGDADAAFAINAGGVAMVAAQAATWGVPMLHASTDYVFAGDNHAPYRVDDAPAPLGVYGASKWAGEQSLAASGADYAIIRTAWLYSPFAANFVKTMLRLAQKNPVVRVVADQFGGPTSALDLADAMLAMLARWPVGGCRRTYHFANGGRASWADFATEVFALATAHGLPAASVTPITTAQYPTPARRPASSLLDMGALSADFAINPRPWRAALASLFDRADFRAEFSADCAGDLPR